MLALGCGFISLQETELQKAIKAQDVEAVRRLLDGGADTAASLSEAGPWALALENLSPSDPRTLEILKLVYARNPRPKSTGMTTPSESLVNGELRVRASSGQRLSPNDQSIHPVEIAARRWSPEGVRFLLDNGLVVKHVSVQNALVTAASNGCEPIVRMLLDAGADVNGLDERNDSALAMARRVNNQQIARLLIDRGARDAR
jgi:ankyrin repeat protein